MTLRQKVKEAVSAGLSAEETAQEMTDRIMALLVEEADELEVKTS